MTLVQLQLLIAPTNEQPAEPEAFWSWGGILVICTGLVLLGFAIDWLLRRKHKDHILLKMSEFQEKLERLPVKDWQVAVARAGVRFWDAVGGVVLPVGRWLGNALNPSGKGVNRSYWVFMCCWVAILGILMVGYRSLGTKLNHWSHTTLVSMSVFLSTGIIAAGVEYLDPSKGRPFYFWRTYYTEFLPIWSVSIAFTLLALGLGTVMHDCTFEAAWFECNAGSSAVLHSLPLSWINFAFDLTTILFSVHILRRVIKNHKNFVPLAVLDIGISGVLTVLLHTVLLTISPEPSLALSDAFPIAWDWFIQVVTFSASSTDPNWPLTPILFTTFIPVALYMSAFLFLGILVKPFARTSAYLCGLLWEKEQTPFLVFAVALSGMLTLTKAFSEWRWFVDKLGG